MRVAYESWAGIIYLTHKSHFALISGLQNWLRRVGDIELIYQKRYNNQLNGDHSLTECMEWQK